MKQEIKEPPLHDTIRPRNLCSEKKKMIDFIKKQKDKKLQSNGNKKKKQLVGYSAGEWTLRELKLYYRYLSNHKNEFTDPQLRKKNKVFIKLAEFIGSRTPDQCRSHHQKATCKYPDFAMLLNQYETRINDLAKMYEQATKPVVKESEKNEVQQFNRQNNQPFTKSAYIQGEKAIVELQNQPKLEQNSQLQIFKQNLQNQKIDKQTGQVFTSNYFNLSYDGENNCLGIEIESGLMQVFQ